MECVPVAIEMANTDMVSEITRYVEAELGWQVVVDSDHYPAALVITDHQRTGRPYIHIGGPELDIASALRAGAKDALVWPRDAPRLRSLDLGTQVIRSGRRLVISQASPQTGASTIALGLAAVYAWAGQKVALAAGPTILQFAGMHHPGRVLACPNLWLVSPQAGPPDGVDMVIVEAPVSTKTQILVGRPDRMLVSTARAYPTIRRVVTIGEGELMVREARTLIGQARHNHLEWSFRIARAGLRGALPQSFPGRFLKALARLVGQPVPGVYAAGQAKRPPALLPPHHGRGRHARMHPPRPQLTPEDLHSGEPTLVSAKQAVGSGTSRASAQNVVDGPGFEGTDMALAKCGAPITAVGEEPK